jgi:putative exporter of polyketide antibiotics
MRARFHPSVRALRRLRVRISCVSRVCIMGACVLACWRACVSACLLACVAACLRPHMRASVPTCLPACLPACLLAFPVLWLERVWRALVGRWAGGGLWAGRGLHYLLFELPYMTCMQTQNQQ